MKKSEVKVGQTLLLADGSHGVVAMFQGRVIISVGGVHAYLQSYDNDLVCNVSSMSVVKDITPVVFGLQNLQPGDIVMFNKLGAGEVISYTRGDDVIRKGILIHDAFLTEEDLEGIIGCNTSKGKWVRGITYKVFGYFPKSQICPKVEEEKL